MRTVERPAKPNVLRDHADQWTDAFRASGKPRPDSRRYAHPEIKRVLNDSSHGKCFYCESLLLPREGGLCLEVDHRRGVKPPERAYDWDNLYLSCDRCNQAKKGRPDIAIEETLDPCDRSVDPAEHLDARLEHARPWSDSTLGRKTIDKLGLNSIELLLLRQRLLSEFEYQLRLRIGDAARHRVVTEEQQKEIERGLTEEFARADMPYSWLFRAKLRRL